MEPSPQSLTVEETCRAFVGLAIDRRALLDACLTRIDDPQGEGARAFIAVHAESARRSSEAAGPPSAARPLAGIPVSIKDLFDEAGWVTTAGSVVLRGSQPAQRDATVVARLRAAGAVIVGRTNMTEFAYSGVGLNPHYGTPKSPFERETGYIPGGSSSGAAVSVADGMALAAIGTDTGGSVRIPAAFCGLVGFMPTVTRVPTDGAFPLAPSFDSVGPIARSVGDCRVLDGVLSNSLLPTTPVAPRSLRLGIASGLPLEALDDAVATTFKASLRKLERAGARVEDVAGIDWARPAALLSAGQITAVECRAVHGALFDRRAEYDPRVAARIVLGERVRATDYVAAHREMLAFRRHVDARLASYDAVVLPTVACLPPRLADFDVDEAYFRLNARVLRNTLIANVLGRCAITLPVGEPGGGPVGLMLMGAGGGDAHLLDVADACARVLNA